MTNIEDIRKNIDEIDRQMAQLYEKRLDLMKDVAEYKLNNDLSVFNGDREEQVINQNSKLLKNKNYINFYRDFIQLQMDQGKQLQLNIMQNNKNQSL